MWGGTGVLGSSVVGGTIKIAKYSKNRITIGKTGTFESVANITKTEHYGGLKEFGFIKKYLVKKLLNQLGGGRINQ